MTDKEDNTQSTEEISMNQSKLVVFLALQSIKGFGMASSLAFYRYTKNVDVDWSDIGAVYQYLQKAMKGESRLKKTSKEEVESALMLIPQLLNQYQQLNIAIVPIWSENYPKRMLLLEKSPVILYGKGNLSLLNAKHTVAIIGTRSPTTIGYRNGFEYGQFAAQADFAVVSGLALGCDTAGHLGCLNHEGGQTIAILGYSLEQNIYPKQNAQLAEQILQKNGLLLSEYPLNTHVTPGLLMQRDQWQAALSDGVIVVETGIKGGTMHTVSFAKKFQREIGCFYSKDRDWQCATSTQGNQLLLNEGKRSIENTETLSEFLQNLKGEAINQIAQ